MKITLIQLKQGDILVSDELRKHNDVILLEDLTTWARVVEHGELIEGYGPIIAGLPGLVSISYSEEYAAQVVEKQLASMALPKSFEVKVEMELVGKCNCACHRLGSQLMHIKPCCYPRYVPKITDNTIKVLRIL